MNVETKLTQITEEVNKEVKREVNLSLGEIGSPEDTVPVLLELMDRITAMMDFQASIITEKERDLEESKYQYKRKEQAAKKKYNEFFVKYKQEDRVKPKDQRRTDKEYEAIASLECCIEVNEEIAAERAYMHSQHELDDAKHNYEILNNHFLAYRKGADLLAVEMKKLGDPRDKYIQKGGY